MIFGGRFKRIEPRYVGDNTNNGVWGINEVYALKEAGVWPSSTDSSKDIYFESNKLLLSSRSSTIIDLSILNSALTVSKFQKQIIDGPNETPVNAMYNDDYSGANGSYAYILTADNNDIAINDQDYTLECWVKPIRRQPNGYYTLFSTYKSGTDGAVFGFDNDGRIFADGGFGNWAFGNITGGINVSSGQWHHIAFCRSNGTLKCFVNGSQYGSSANSSKVHTANYMRVGNHDTQSFVGHITEVRLAVGVVRYTSSFSVPPIPLPLIEEEISPLAPILSGDSLYGDQSVELFWRNGFNGGSDITSFDIEHATLSDMSNAISENLPVSFAIGGTDTYWNSVALLLKADGDNGTTQFTDLSKTTKTITAYGSAQVSTSQSKFGTGSLSLPSAGSSENSDRLEITSDASFNFGTSDFTIEAWVYFEGFSNEETIVAKSNNSGGSYRLVCAGASRNLAFYAESQNVVSSNNVFTTGQWYHVAACRTNGTLRLFIDGSEVSSGPMTINLSNNVPLTIGNYPVFGSYSSGYEATFDGFIDEVRITNSARYQTSFTIPTSSYPYYTSLPTTYEVVNLTNDIPYYFRIRANNVVGNGTYSNIIGPFTPSATLPQRLIGGSTTPSGNDPYEYDISLLLHFDGADASTTFTDANVPAKTATLAGTPTISTTQSKYGGASGSFLNNGDYLSFASSQDFLFASGDFTIEAWIYPIAPATDPFGMERGIVGIWSAVTPSAQSWLLYLQGGSLKFIAEIVTGDNVVFDVPNVVTQEQWYHVAVVRNGTQMYLFVDGVRVSTYNCGTSNMTDGSNTLGVGGYNRGNSTSATFNGYIDDLRITKGVARYTADFSVPTAAFPDPPVPPAYIGTAFKQDNYSESTALANKIFDNSLSNNTTNQWRTTVLNSAFGVDFGIIQQVLRYRMWRNTGNEGTPTSWILQGSNTSSDWTNLQNNNNQSTYGSWVNIDTRSLVNLPLVTGSSPANQPYGEFVVSNPGNYRYYRLFVSAVRADGPGTTTNRIFLAEMQFLGIIAAANTPTNLSANPANEGASLSWSWSGANFVNYTVEWSSDGGSTVLGSATTTTPTYNVTGLVNGSSYVFRVKATNTVGDSSFTSWSDPVVPAAGYSPIEDNVFRFVMDENATTAIVQADTTTNYYKVVSSTGQDSGVIYNGGNWGPWPYYMSNATVSNMPTGQQKTLQVISCDSSGNPSGELRYVGLKPTTQNILIVDASGCTSLNGFAVPSSTFYQYSYMGSPSQLPSTITEIRCIGVRSQYGSWSQWNQNYPPFVMEGINVAGQQLSAAALNQMYTDLGTSRSVGAMIGVSANPGVGADDPSIATNKGYTVFGS